MEEIVEKVSAAQYVTVMDLSKGYFQIPLTPRAQRYAAFVTPFGTYIPKKMMFGLLEKPGERRERKREREKKEKRARKRQGLVVLGSGEENPRVLFDDADQ
ncbi:hypothetical protein TNCV_1639091 [Trichonephila clavipes]|nr:hypothetical protein TNCV_1639091 [Trichonephila clavipes]